MTTSVHDSQIGPVESPNQQNHNGPSSASSILMLAKSLVRFRVLRELLLILAFCLLTALMTWPYVTRLRDAVAGPGDPYLIAWTMWWDYHQTFNDPLHLFHSNTFYPYKYTLAFSETCYGLALPFFPLFALGLRPLTVHSIAMFLGFALSGYGAFRLMRTLTGSTSAAWVAGILFAFIPYRFNLMAQLMYLFSVWIPLLFEAFILFARERSWKRAIWLGFAFFMTGLTTITWLLLCLVPLALLTLIFLTRYGAWRDKHFWSRSAVSLCVALIALLPFTLPFYIVSKLYGFKRTVDDVRSHSAAPIHWLVAEGRSKIWHRMGENIPDAWKFQMFPGLLALLFPLVEFYLGSASLATDDARDARRTWWVRRLDILAIVLLILTVPSIGFNESSAPAKLFFRHLRPERLLTLFLIVVIARLCLAFPGFLKQRRHVNLIQTIRSGGDALWIGGVLGIVGFVYSIGWNFFFYRLLYDLMPGFKSIRAPMRGAMFAYLGLSILSGLGVKRLADLITTRYPKVQESLVFVVACLLLLVELNGAPLYFIRGEVYADKVTQRLKQSAMKGGIVYFPAGRAYNQRYMLRAADHEKPLILGTSGFSPPYVEQIEQMTSAGRIPAELMDVLEQIPASYLVVANQYIPDQRKLDFEVFLGKAIASGRLRFINRFDASNDLYAITKTEPAAISEASLPADLSISDWAAKIREDSVSSLDKPKKWAQKLYRGHVAVYGKMPRYREFMRDLETISRNVIVGSEEQEQRFSDNLNSLFDEWTKSKEFNSIFGRLKSTEFVDRLLENAGIQVDPNRRTELIEALLDHRETRAGVLSRIVDEQPLVEKFEYPSLVVLHYFAFLHRNPSDPPDGDLSGYNFWVGDLERNHDPSKLAVAFKRAGEYQQIRTSP